ncbi:MAG: carotenoid biosynthesis protein [Chloroflexi bacterium]|nr:carotenoid biosynthesis protein [Chloroflexota bacterium]
MNTVTSSIKALLSNASPLLIVWVAGLLALPIMQWSAGQQGMVAVVIVGVLLQASVVVLYLAQAAGTRRGTAIVISIAALAWAAEALGSRVGVPFGAYDYAGKLQPQLLGVPLLIPLAWLMMLPPAWAVAQRITGRVAGPAFIAVSALAFTAWDLYLDPQMVQWGLWVWDAPGAYFGIPLVNFAGWLLVSGLITALVRPPALPQQPLLIIYALVWLIEVVGQVLFWQLPGPALCGFAGMGVFLVWAWRSRASATSASPADTAPPAPGRSRN